MLQVCFDCYGTYTTDSVYQWDLNRRLAIHGLDYDSAPAIHFSNKKSTEALVVQSTIEDGVIYCDVPNILLQDPYDIVGYVCECLDQELTTYETIRIPVKPRVKPADYAYENNVEILTYYSLMSEITSIKASTEKDLNSMDASKASKAELNAVKVEVENNLSTEIDKVENEIASERARIDQLVASPELGEGDFEKELTDIRIDKNGTTHGSAGTAVREQILELDSKIDANVSTLSSEIEDIGSAMVKDYVLHKKSVNASGVEDTSIISLLTDILEVKNGDSVSIGTGYKFRTVEYNSDGSFKGILHDWVNSYTYSETKYIKLQIVKEDRTTIYGEDIINISSSLSATFITKSYKKVATFEDLSNVYHGLGDIYKVSGNITDVTIRNSLLLVSGVEFDSITFKDFNGNIDSEDFVLYLKLIDDTKQWVSLKDKTIYHYDSLKIVEFEVYIEPNKLSNAINVDGIIYTSNEMLGYLTEQVENGKKDIATMNAKTYSKWKMFTFSDDFKIISLASMDGTRWESIGNSAFSGDSGTNMRDPSVIRVDDVYYMIYSRILETDDGTGSMYPTSKYIGLAKSYDLITWEPMTPIEFDGYYNLWAPEWYKKKDGSFGVVLSCVKNGEEDFKAYTFDVTDFENFTYSSLTPLATSNVSNLFDMHLKNINGVYYLAYSAGLRARLAKEVDGIITGYVPNANWYSESLEGSYIVEMDGKYRMYLADHTVVPNRISYTESTDLVNWGDLVPCITPMDSLQHCTIIYEDEWINHKFNLL